MPAKSTGCTDKDEAHFTVMTWLKDGFLPSGNNQEPRTSKDVFNIDEIIFKIKHAPLNNEDTEKIIQELKSKGLIQGVVYSAGTHQTLIEFLTEFWTWDISPYVAEKQAYKQRIGHDHVETMLRNIKLYWKPYFNTNYPGLHLHALNRDMLRGFTIWVSQQHKRSRDKVKRKLEELISPRTCNLILTSGTTALKWAFDNSLINKNPATGLKKFSLNTKKRGILTDEEMRKLFKSGDWRGNENARLCSLLCSQTGLRIGEAIALRVRDIEKDRLKVLHSFSKVDGLKKPKNGETRQVPILPETRRLIIDYAKQNPHGYQPDHFIFWQVDNKDLPVRAETVTGRFRVAVDSILSEGERKARNIVFHGLRHYYIKKMSLALDKRAMMLSGHKSEAVFEGYANHATEEDFKRAAAASEEVFGRVLQFPEKEAK